jgi:opacity protein-like surface antigen
MKKLIFVSMLLIASQCLSQSRDIVVMGIGNLTKSSVGVFENQNGIQQTMKGSAGIGLGYEQWWNNNGVSIVGAWTPTNSKLSAITGTPGRNGTNTVGATLVIWPITRYEIGVVYQHKFLSDQKLSPYAGIGGVGKILWGGKCSATVTSCSGLDGQYGATIGGGISYQLTKKVDAKIGSRIDLVKASTFGDGTYRSSLTIEFEPQIGIVYKF